MAVSKNLTPRYAVACSQDEALTAREFLPAVVKWQHWDTLIPAGLTARYDLDHLLGLESDIDQSAEI